MGILYGANHNHCFIADGMWHQGGKNFKGSCKKEAGRTGLSGMLLCIYKFKLEIKQKLCQSKEKIE